MSRLGEGLRRDPVLAAYLVFALVVTAYDVMILALAPFDVPAARHLQERVVPYTGWVWLALLMPFKPRSAPPPGQPVEVPGR